MPYIQHALVNGARRAIRKKSIIEPLSKDKRMEVNAAIIFMMLLVLMRTCMAIAFYPLAGKGQVQALRLAAARFFLF
ncbi:hypothetical protein [Rhodoferax sp.]|uniref:hypothetical protein n=1 Tax=Rhodoferax sp. TaxID=50421 RepID=UPI00374CF5AE